MSTWPSTACSVRVSDRSASLGRLVHRAPEHHVGRDQPVLTVQKERHERLVLQPAQRESQVLAHRVGVVQQRVLLHLFAGHPARQLDDHGQRGGPRRPQTDHAHQLRRFGGQQPGQRPVALVQQLQRQPHGRLASRAGAQQDGQQLGAGQRLGPMAQQPLARALGLGPLGKRRSVQRVPIAAQKAVRPDHRQHGRLCCGQAVVFYNVGYGSFMKPPHTFPGGRARHP